MDMHRQKIKRKEPSKHSVTSVSRKFIYTVIIPTLLAWVMYFLMMNVYFINHTLSAQQTYLTTSVAQLDLALANIDNLVASVESSPEIVFYLDRYNEKRDMLYLLVKSVRDYCSNLVNGHAAVNALKIYSKKDALLFSDPFYPYDEMALTPEQQMNLENMSYSDLMWISKPSVSGDTALATPSFYAYTKIYSFDYRSTVGYIEVELHPNVMNEFFMQFSDTSFTPDGSFTAFQNGSVIYGLESDLSLLQNQLLSGLQEDEIRLDYLRNQYIITRSGTLDLTFMMHGKITDLLRLSAGFPISILVAIILILLALAFFFFGNMNYLSKQILHFSNHIKSSNPNDLYAYTNGSHKIRQHYTELDNLIESYNGLINENTALVSKMNILRLLNQNAKYQALQAQIHPHFFFGTLENIRMLAIQNRDTETADLIYSLSSIFRHAIADSAKGVTLEKEMEIVGNYMLIQQHRFGSRLTFQTQIAPELLNINVPPFLLQPLVENAIMYGAANTLDECLVTVSVQKQGSLLEFQVSNTGEPIAADRLNEVNQLLAGEITLEAFKGKSNGVALYNIKERIQIFYRGKPSIQILLDGYVTKVIVKIEGGDQHISDSDS